MGNNSYIDAAIERFRRNPSDLDSVVDLVGRLRSAGMVDDAFRLCRSVMKLHSGAYEFLIEFAEVLCLRCDAAGARRVFERLTGMNPDRFEAWNGLGALELSEGNLEAADEALKRALELAPDNAEALRNAGNCSAVRGDKTLAADYFERALSRYGKEAVERKGSDAKILAAMAEVHLLLNNYDKALECGKRAASAAPSDPASWSALRKAAVRLRDGESYYRAVIAMINDIRDDDLVMSVRDLRGMGFEREAEELLGYTVKINKKSAMADALPFAESRARELTEVTGGAMEYKIINRKSR
ncbi:MAG: tetratricopeptide repeat protein [Chitinispirillales bacterium]|jgi:Flp pilus assembly protein TadD|nr:tetratricopeptide repeat protein [Chitinispirillales bacterium]